jgi:hypothetical protein
MKMQAELARISAQRAQSALCSVIGNYISHFLRDSYVKIA